MSLLESWLLILERSVIVTVSEEQIDLFSGGPLKVSREWGLSI